MPACCPAFATARLVALLLLVGYLFPTGNSCAEPPEARYIFPAGGQVGQDVAARVGGLYFHGEASFRAYGTGVRGPDRIREIPTRWFEGPVIPQPASQRAEDYPKDHEAKLHIAADAAPGIYYWRAWTSQGATALMPFVVGTLPEIVEDEIDGSPIPVVVSLPVTINGRMFPREDVDVWEFQAAAGQVIACEVVAARIGSPLDAILQVFDPDGRKLAENNDYFSVDPFVRFTAPRAGTYKLRICDVNFDGLQHFVYRLTVSAGPYVDAYYPLGGRRGTVLQLHCPASGLPGEAVNLALPSLGIGPALHAVQIPSADHALPIALELDDLDEVLEAEPNDNQSGAAVQPLPAVWNGRIDRPGDADIWAFAAVKSENLTFDVRASRLGSPLDSVLAILDAAGKELARSDDIAGATDSQLAWTAPADGVFFAKVCDRFAARGGPRFVYRLRATKAAAPDFQLTLGTDSVTALREGEGKLPVNVRRAGGFNGPIKLHVAGLPEGVAVDGLEISQGTAAANLVFKPSKAAKIGVSELAITGTAEIGDAKMPVTRAATFNKGRSFPDHDVCLLAVALPTPFKFSSTYVASYAAQGTTYRRHYKIDRGGYAGPLTISLADKQARHLQGVTGPVITLPPEAHEFTYAVQLSPWLEVGRTSRTTLMAIGEVVDHDGTRHRVSFSSQAQNEHIVIQADPAPLTIRAAGSLLCDPAHPVAFAVQVQRSATVPYPVTLELILPAHIRGVTAAPVVVPSDKSEGTLELHFAPDAGPFNMPLAIRAVARHGDDVFLAETRFDVVPPRKAP